MEEESYFEGSRKVLFHNEFNTQIPFSVQENCFIKISEFSFFPLFPLFFFLSSSSFFSASPRIASRDYKVSKGVK